MARKTKDDSKKLKNKNKAAKTAASKKQPMKTSTIRVRVNAIENPTPKTKANKKDRRKRKKEKPKKEINTKKLLKGLGIVCLIAAAIVFLFTTALFNVTKIDVVGNESVSDEEIISLSQIKLNENMFKYLKPVITENIKSNPYVEEVKIARILPDKIQITVQERKAKFMVKLLDSYAYINSQGYILEITNQTKELPIIEGVSTPEEEIIVGKRLNNDDLKKLEVVLQLISSCEENEISRYITSINIENSNEYTMYMAEKLKTIYMGNSSNLDTKILYVKVILQSEEGNEGEIYVNGDLNDGFQPFFREKV